MFCSLFKISMAWKNFQKQFQKVVYEISVNNSAHMW